MLLGAVGESKIVDHVWTNRFGYVHLLTALGAKTEVIGNSVSIWPSKLRAPDNVMVAMDSRAAAMALLASLGVDGVVRICGLEHLDRSYERLLNKLQAIGAQVERLQGCK